MFYLESSESSESSEFIIIHHYSRGMQLAYYALWLMFQRSVNMSESTVHTAIKKCQSISSHPTTKLWEQEKESALGSSFKFTGT